MLSRAPGPVLKAARRGAPRFGGRPPAACRDHVRPGERVNRAAQPATASHWPSVRHGPGYGRCLAPLAADECASRARVRWTQSRRPWMLALADRCPSGDGDGPPAVPAVYRGTAGRPGPVLFTLGVDGERFAIRQAGDGGTAYDWLSGPNKGYGFGSSGTPN